MFPLASCGPTTQEIVAPEEAMHMGHATKLVTDMNQRLAYGVCAEDSLEAGGPCRFGAEPKPSK